MLEKINLQNQKHANRNQLIVKQVQPFKCIASYPEIYFNQEKLIGSVWLSNNVKISGFRHPSLFFKERGRG